jgi:crotonobetainyl-CoA:carnitine CoA-transferase CaiB-like acyl-CoA transferase
MDGTPSEISRPAPTLGQHTEDVLAELGVDTKRIEALRARGVLGGS